jgi:hypothetical protein
VNRDALLLLLSKDAGIPLDVAIAVRDYRDGLPETSPEGHDEIKNLDQLVAEVGAEQEPAFGSGSGNQIEGSGSGNADAIGDTPGPSFTEEHKEMLDPCGVAGPARDVLLRHSRPDGTAERATDRFPQRRTD